MGGTEIDIHGDPLDERSQGAKTLKTTLLVGGLEHVLFSHILGIIIPIDYFFFRGVAIPPTRHCIPQ